MTRHPYYQRYHNELQNILRKIELKIYKTNKKRLTDYIEFLQTEIKSEPARIVTLLNPILKFCKILNKPLDRANKEDAKKIVQFADNNEQWKERTKGDFKAIYKQYRKWLTGNIDFPDDVRWIKGKVLLNYKKVIEKTPDQIMNIDEFKKFLSNCNSPRDKAMFGMIGELGLRPKEGIMLKIKNIDTTNKEYVIVTVPSDTKTGSRPVPLIFSKKWVLEWVLKYHPDKDNKESYLFVQERRNRDQSITYKGLVDRFSNILKMSGIKKKLTLYDFRKFSYTFKATKGWSDQQIKAFHGLKPKSKAIDVYIKMNCKDLLDPIKELYGIKVVKVKNKEMEIILCPNCNTQNPSVNKQCETCGVYLSIEEANNALQNSKEAKDKELNDLKLQMQAQNEQMKNQMKRFKDSIMKGLGEEIQKKIEELKTA